MSGNEASPRDLHVRVALLEQAMVHAEDRSQLHQSMLEARARAAEHQVGTLAEQSGWLYQRLLSHEESGRATALRLEQASTAAVSLKERQDKFEQMAVRLRYSAAAVLMILVAGDRVSPEVKGIALKAIGL